MKLRLVILMSIILLGCSVEETLEENKTEEAKEIILGQRIEFSTKNVIPDNLTLLQLSKTQNVNKTSVLEKPNSGGGLEFLLDNNENIVFLNRSFSGLSDSQISAKSTTLFLLTFNTTFLNSSTEEQKSYINKILNEDAFNEAIDLLRNQSEINIYKREYMDKIRAISSKIFPITVEEDNLNNESGKAGLLKTKVIKTEFVGNKVILTNQASFHVGIDVYSNGLSIAHLLLKPNEKKEYELTNEAVPYEFKVRSGSVNSITNYIEADINAYEADYRVITYETVKALLTKLTGKECLDQFFNQFFENYEFTRDFEECKGDIDCGVANGTELFLINIVEPTLNDCSGQLGWGLIIKKIKDLLKALDFRDFLRSVTVSLRYPFYETDYDICLGVIRNEINECNSIPSTLSAFDPFPANNANNIKPDGELDFYIGSNTPSDGTFKIYFGKESNPPLFKEVSSDIHKIQYSGLSLDTTYYWKVETLNTRGDVLVSSPKWKFTTLKELYDDNPTIITNAITNRTQFTAVSGGNITNNSEALITAKGLVWSTSSDPTLNGMNSFTFEGSGNNSFSSTMTNLTPNTPYYVCAYITDSSGKTVYGNIVPFSTLAQENNVSKPIVSTNDATSPTQTSAVSGGEISNDGGDL